jgi:hypothetical protein
VWFVSEQCHPVPLTVDAVEVSALSRLWQSGELLVAAGNALFLSQSKHKSSSTLDACL